VRVSLSVGPEFEMTESWISRCGCAPDGDALTKGSGDDIKRFLLLATRLL
jgi:hypothetical protein